MRVPKRLVLIILVAAALLILTAVFTRYVAPLLFEPDQRKIERLVRNAASAVEKGDVDFFKDAISDDYVGPLLVTKTSILEAFDRELANVEELKVNIESIEIELEGEADASVVLRFLVSGFYIGSDLYNRIPFRGLASKDGEAETGYLELKKESDKRWRVVGTQIKDFKGR
jgi:hypothetical protein